MTLSSYNDIFKTDFGGKLPTATVQGAPSYNMNTDVGRGMYGMTLGAGGAGADLTGTQAFLGAWNPGNDTKQDQFGKYTYDTSTLGGLAGQLGIDTSKYNLGTDVSDADYYKLSNDLNEQLKNYHYISGMSQGWNPNQDSRGADRTLYLDDGTGNLNPVTPPVDYHAREKGNWFQENPEFVAAASILAGGYLGGTALAGAAGAGAGGVGATGAAVGAGDAAAMGAASAGATGAGTSGLSGSIANALGLGSQWGALPAWGQGAVTGALQGGVTSGLQGGNIGKGILMGGLSGGVGAWAGPALSSYTGLPAWASKGLVSAGLGGLTSGSWQGALGSGLTSLATSGLTDAGVNPQVAGLAAKYGVGAGLSSLSEGTTQPGGGGATGLSGGTGGGSSQKTFNASLLGNPQLGAAAAQQAAFLRDSYAPVAQEAAKKKQAQSLLDELENA